MRSRAERFYEKVVPIPMSGCYLWVGSLDNRGYGQFFDGRRSAAGHKIPSKAHRVAYEIAYGPIADGLVVCHRCDTPTCVRPEHLFLGTFRDNSQDMVRKGRCLAGWQNKKKTHCKHGHKLSGRNLKVDANGHRRCRACAVRRTLESKARRIAA